MEKRDDEIERQEGEPEIISDFPTPPKYYLNYGPGGNPLPPPPLPEKGAYSMFGEERKLDERTPTLEAQGLKTLYDTNGNLKEELKKLVKGSRKKFVVLVQLLSSNAEQEDIHQKFEDLDMSFINMLYLVNEMRTDQAKAELRDMLKQQVKAKRQAIEILHRTIETSGTSIEEAFTQAGTLPAADTEMTVATENFSRDSVPAVDAVEEEFKRQRTEDYNTGS